MTEEKSLTPTGFVWDTDMPAVSLLWNTNVAVMTCENNFPLRVGVAACGGSHSEGWQGYALLSAASLDSTSLMGTSPPPPPPHTHLC